MCCAQAAVLYVVLAEQARTQRFRKEFQRIPAENHAEKPEQSWRSVHDKSAEYLTKTQRQRAAQQRDRDRDRNVKTARASS